LLFEKITTRFSLFSLVFENNLDEFFQSIFRKIKEQ